MLTSANKYSYLALGGKDMPLKTLGFYNVGRL